MIRKLVVLLFACLMLIGPGMVITSGAVLAQSPDAPWGRDENGDPLVGTRNNPGVDLEAACITYASLDYCLPYHQNSCQIRGFAAACRYYQMGSNCYGGDPQVCQYYIALLQANRACTLDGDGNACAWLQQQP